MCALDIGTQMLTGVRVSTEYEEGAKEEEAERTSEDDGKDEPDVVAHNEQHGRISQRELHRVEHSEDRGVSEFAQSAHLRFPLRRLDQLAT